MSVEVQKNIAEFIVNTRYGQVEPRFIKDIKYRIIDWLGCATAGRLIISRRKLLGLIGKL